MVTSGRGITRLQKGMDERTPKWEGKEEQKKTMEPVASMEEAKQNTTVKPPFELEAIRKTTVKTTLRVLGKEEEKTTVRAAQRMEEAKEKTTVKPFPRVEGAKDETTVKPFTVLKGADENNPSTDQTKAKEPPAAVQTARPVPVVTQQKKLRAADFKSEPKWDFEDKYLLDASSPPSVGVLAMCAHQERCLPLDLLFCCLLGMQVPFAVKDDLQAGRSTPGYMQMLLGPREVNL